jgi:nitrogen-specific signal transduction histidine kinase
MLSRVDRHIAQNNSVGAKQQEEINYVLKRVNDVMHSGKVKRITIKRKRK